MIPIYVARKEVSVVPTEPTETGCYLKIATMFDPASNPITITCNGVTYVSGAEFTMTAYGHAWTGEVLIPNLTELRYYDWIVTQNSFSDAGYVNRLPKVGEPHTVILYSCDNNTNLTNQNYATPNIANPDTTIGLWRYVKDLLDTGVFISLIAGLDDFSGYVDSKVIEDTYTGASGLSATLAINNGANADDASLAYLSYLGCTGGSGVVTYDDLIALDSARGLITHWGREENRAYCRNRIPRKLIAGDHEYVNDIGYITDSTAGSNPRWVTYQVTEGVGKTAFDAFCNTGGLTLSNSGAGDAHANHWTLTAGNLQLLAFDVVTNATGGVTTKESEGLPTTPLPAQMTAVYGAGQIADIKAEAVASTAKFKLLLLPSGLMYCADGATSLNGHLAQYPLFNHCIAEFASLFTADANGLMSTGFGNGARSCVVAISGDLHRRNTIRYKNAAYAGNKNLEFEHWHTGTINGSVNFQNSTGLSVGDTYTSAADGGIATAQLLSDEMVEAGKVYSLVVVTDNGAAKPKLKVQAIGGSVQVGDVDYIAPFIAYEREYIAGIGNYSLPVSDNKYARLAAAEFI